MRSMTPDEVATLLFDTADMSYSAHFKARIRQDVNSGRRPINGRMFGILKARMLHVDCPPESSPSTVRPNEA